MSIFNELKQYCPCGFVLREDIAKITGGLLNYHTMAHLDSRGKGIPNYKIGRRVAYNIDDVIIWLENNTKLINFEK